MAFLPTTREEMLEQGFEQVDFVYVLGMRMLIILLLDVPSSPEHCRRSATAVPFYRSLTGIATKNFCSSALLVWDFWFRRGT